MNISAVILSKNEEINIEECIDSLNFCDEIIVIDDNSTDETVEKAKKLGVTVYTNSLNDDFSAQRNFALDKASGKWILFLDADERVTADLKEEILRVISQSNKNGFYLTRQAILFGKKLRFGEYSSGGPFANQKLLRLAKKGTGKWKRAVHEHWEIRGDIGTLRFELLHFPHPTIKDFVDHLNYFSTIHAKSVIQEGKTPDMFKVICWPILKFLYNIFIRCSFRDGLEGVITTVMMSFHSFLAWSKAWIIKNRN